MRICDFLSVKDSLSLPDRKQALQHPGWHKSMQREFDALVKNGTWDLIPPDPSKNVVSNKWLFRLKPHQVNPDVKLKSHLFAKGFS